MTFENIVILEDIAVFDIIYRKFLESCNNDINNYINKYKQDIKSKVVMWPEIVAIISSLGASK